LTEFPLREEEFRPPSPRPDHHRVHAAKFHGNKPYRILSRSSSLNSASPPTGLHPSPWSLSLSHLTHISPIKAHSVYPVSVPGDLSPFVRPPQLPQLGYFACQNISPRSRSFKFRFHRFLIEDVVIGSWFYTCVSTAHY
jgi:hypothetical protein